MFSRRREKVMCNDIVQFNDLKYHRIVSIYINYCTPLNSERENIGKNKIKLHIIIFTENDSCFSLIAFFTIECTFFLRCR